MKSILTTISMAALLSITALAIYSHPSFAQILTSTSVTEIDSSLQLGISRAFGERQGHVVILDTETGRLLAKVEINNPKSKTYAPGATIKPFIALAGLELGKRQAEQRYDFGGHIVTAQRHRFVDSHPGGHGLINMHESLVLSSDTYYYALANDLGIDAMQGFLGQFGFGKKTGADVTDEPSGILPSPEWKRERFKDKDSRFQHWYPSENLSLGIGQGYLMATPLQLARATAAIANGGKLYRPHLTDNTNQEELQRSIDLNPDNLKIIRDAMHTATLNGAAQLAFRNSDYPVAGKTGASFVWLPKNSETSPSYNDSTKDHSIFIGYAPAQTPKVAIAVIVEEGGPGYRSAAPIARAIFDKILLGQRIPGLIEQLPEHCGDASD